MSGWQHIEAGHYLTESHTEVAHVERELNTRGPWRIHVRRTGTLTETTRPEEFRTAEDARMFYDSELRPKR